MRGAGEILRSIVDFIADDRCQLCGRDRPGAGEGLDPVRRAVTAPARVGPVVNHPVCAPCASLLVPSSAEGVVGWRLPGGAVLARGVLVPAAGGGDPAAAPGPVRVVSAFDTNPTLLALIHRLKFSRVTCLVPGLACAVAEAVPGAVLDPAAVLVPVPMEARARRRRGFNQAGLLAAALSRWWALPVAGDAVVKPTPTSPQSLAGRNQRLANVLHAFRPGPSPVAGRPVIIIDDLVTTGATAAVVASTLPGARSVTVACVGRAP